MGKSDVDKTNAANLQIARETNESNYNIAQMSNEYNSAQLDKQIAEQWRMWKAENEYNTPAAQAQRMREAGLNPVLSDIGTGSASSMSSPSPQPAVAPTMVGATMQPDNTFERIIGSLGALQNSLNSFVDNTYKQTQIVGATQNNDYARQSQQYMLDMLKNSKLISDITAGNEKRRQINLVIVKRKHIVPPNGEKFTDLCRKTCTAAKVITGASRSVFNRLH